MKIVLTTTFLVAILAIGVLGINNNISNNINNVSAQEGAITPEGMNNTMSTENVTQWTGNATLAYAMDHMGNETKPMNATLAYAQGEGANQTMQDAGQSVNQTGEKVQEGASNLGSKVTEGAKDLAGNVGDKLENIGK